MNLRFAAARAIANFAAKMSGQDSQIFAKTLWGNSIMPPRKGSKELLDAFETMPWLRAISGRIGFAASSVPWCLFAATKQQVDGGKGHIAYRHRSVQRNQNPQQRMAIYKDLRSKDSLKEIENHPALDLLDHGNTSFPGPVCVQITQQQLDLVGESIWVLDRNGIPMGQDAKRGMPTDIWPMPATWVTRFPTNDRPLYLITSPRGSQEVPAEDVIHFRQPRPVDPYSNGTGVAHSLSDELETDEYAAKHIKAHFRNSARPDMLITGEGFTKQEVDRVEDQWLKKLVGQAGKPHFMNRKLNVEVIQSTFQDMQLTDLRKDQRDILIHVYGVPPEILGIIENSNRSTIDAADYLFAKYVMVPRLEFLRMYLQIHLIEKYDNRLILDYVNPVMEDREFELKVRSAAPYGWTVDEWRELGGSAPLDAKKGQIYVVDFNKTAVEDLTELIGAENPKTPPTSQDTEDAKPTPAPADGTDA